MADVLPKLIGWFSAIPSVMINPRRINKKMEAILFLADDF